MSKRQRMEGLASTWIATAHRYGNTSQQAQEIAAKLRKGWRNVTPAAVVALSTHIVRAYIDRGIEPTLRQLYYRLVGFGIAPNEKNAYSKIGQALAAARKSGDFPLDWLVDLTRKPKPTYTHVLDNPNTAAKLLIEDIVEAEGRYLTMARWGGQSVLPSVFVEKDALSSVFVKPCRETGVGLFVCRGYPSISALYQWVKETQSAIDRNRVQVETVVIEYFGDHDPDGLCIPESTMDALQDVAVQAGSDLFASVPVELNRRALTLDQIADVDAPPFPAKPSSSRYEGYVQSTGQTDAWELDALPPEYLDRLIRNSVNEHFNREQYDVPADSVRRAREVFRKKLRSGEITDEALRRLS